MSETGWPEKSRGALTWQYGSVPQFDRRQLLGQRPVTIWFTGLPSSGKSTLAFELERRLIQRGRACAVLDGDNVRHGLCADLGFSPNDRRENIRRVAEVARLMNDAGLIVISAFIAPYEADRCMARDIVGEERFVQIYLSADVDICERRDPKGLYGRARRGEILGFTGVDSPYEVPTKADLVLATAVESVQACLQSLVAFVSPRIDLGCAQCGRDPEPFARNE